MTTWGDLFTPRQALALTTLIRKINDSYTESKWVTKSSLTNRLVSEPEVFRQNAGLLQAFTRAQVNNVLTQRQGRGIY